ncbi:MAG TPA: glycoside hydrolase family 16 protein [Noviherbaspirillum sp.]
MATVKLRSLALLLVLVAGLGVALVACAKKDEKHAKSEEKKIAERHAEYVKKAGTEKIPYGQDPKEWALSFSEEFDRFNPALWNDHIWYERSNPTINYAVEDGKLKIWPQRDASGKFFNRTLDTDGRYYQTYGYFEMEAKLPRGKGTWPAFWLFNHIDKRRPEIDIMEAYAGGIAPWGYKDKEGVSRPTAYGVTVWLDENVKADGLQWDARRDLSAKFHKYAVKWEPERLIFYFDGRKVHEIRARMPDPKYIILDLWFGSDSGEPDDSTPQGKSNSFEINYVRAWQFRKPPESLPPPSPLPSRDDSKMVR